MGQLISQINSSDWLDKTEPLGYSIFDLAAQEEAAAKADKSTEEPTQEGVPAEKKA